MTMRMPFLWVIEVCGDLEVLLKLLFNALVRFPGSPTNHAVCPSALVLLFRYGQLAIRNYT